VSHIMYRTTRVGFFKFTDDEAPIEGRIDGRTVTIQPHYAQVEVDMEVYDTHRWRAYVTGARMRKNGKPGSTLTSITLTSDKVVGWPVQPVLQALADQVREAGR
jgi:hypothetical protein